MMERRTAERVATDNSNPVYPVHVSRRRPARRSGIHVFTSESCREVMGGERDGAKGSSLESVDSASFVKIARHDPDGSRRSFRRAGRYLR